MLDEKIGSMKVNILTGELTEELEVMTMREKGGRVVYFIVIF